MSFLVFAQCDKRLPPLFTSIVEHCGGGSCVKLRFFCLVHADLSLSHFARCNYDRFCELDLLFASCGFVKISVHPKTSPQPVIDRFHKFCSTHHEVGTF